MSQNILKYRKSTLKKQKEKCAKNLKNALKGKNTQIDKYVNAYIVETGLY